MSDGAIDWSKGLLPAVVQDVDTGLVLMLGYMNAEALEVTRACGQVTFYSRSKQRLWTKGESSGHVLQLVSIQLDCDGDCVLVRAQQVGAACHTGTRDCFEAGGDLTAVNNLIAEDNTTKIDTGEDA